MTNRATNNVSPSAALVLLTGLALGVITAWALSATGREKLASLGTAEFDPNKVLKKAASALQGAIDQVVEAVDKSSRTFNS